MSNLEKNRKKLIDRQNYAKELKDKLTIMKSIGDRKLDCRYGTFDKLSHVWVCYKWKFIKEWLTFRIKARKYWYECERCTFKMIIREDSDV